MVIDEARISGGRDNEQAKPSVQVESSGSPTRKHLLCLSRYPTLNPPVCDPVEWPLRMENIQAQGEGSDRDSHSGIRTAGKIPDQ